MPHLAYPFPDNVPSQVLWEGCMKWGLKATGSQWWNQWQCILLQACFVTFWTHLSCQASHLAARSSKRDYELSEKVLFFFFCCCCSKCCLINSLLATFSCTLRSGDWLLSGPFLHVVLHLAGLLCSLSVLFIYFLSREVPIHAFLCKWSHIPGVAFPIPMQLSWDRQWVLQLPQRMGTKCLHEGEQHELSFHFTFFRELPASRSTLTLPMASSALMLSTTEVNRNFVVFRNCQRLSF